MKALRQIGHGNPADVVKLVDLPDPVPGPGEILVRMEAAAVHLADIKIMVGEEGFRRTSFPFTPGFEGIGRVVSIGDAVTQYKVGDRVFPWWGAGTFSELVCTAAAKALPAPEGDACQLALMMVNGMTAVVLLEDFASFKPGEWLLQNGANSNCGRYLIVLAKERGVRTVNVVRRPEVADELKRLGADVIVQDCDDPAELKARVDTATGNALLKVGIDMVAGAATNRIARCVAKDGIVVNYGYISGKACEIHFSEMFWRNVKLVGMSTGRGLAIRSQETIRAIYANLAHKIADGRLAAAIAGAYPLSRAAEAFAHAVRTGADREGKIVLLP